jgi:hypothetical protein
MSIEDRVRDLEKLINGNRGLYTELQELTKAYVNHVHGRERVETATIARLTQLENLIHDLLKPVHSDRASHPVLPEHPGYTIENTQASNATSDWSSTPRTKMVPQILGKLQIEYGIRFQGGRVARWSSEESVDKSILFYRDAVKVKRWVSEWTPVEEKEGQPLVEEDRDQDLYSEEY